MDGDRFDDLTRILGSGRSRRGVFKALGAAALSAVGLGRASAFAKNDGSGGNGNSACAHWCHQQFSGSAAGHCTSDAAHGAGPCYECGPNAPAGSTAQLCGGVCIPACVASDQCHVAGICDQASGQCTNPPKADGATCDDGNACTVGDSCQAGVCQSGSPVVCKPADQCHKPGVCQAATGQCTYNDKPNGASCNDGNPCTIGDTCQQGVCQGGAAMVCSASDQCHVAGTCDPTTGTCTNPPAKDGTGCSDGNACTTNDSCQAGTCVGGAALVCDSHNPCVIDSCDATKGCIQTFKPQDTACDDGNACNGHEVCNGAGTCVAGTPVVCMPLDQCHDVGTCDPATGACSNPAKANGTACNDGNACTVGDNCQAGTCMSGAAKVCAPSDQCHGPGTCDPASGACSNPPLANNTPCNDGNACTQTDTCQGGACTGGNPVVCAPMGQCHVAGTCDPTTGTCTNPNAADGTACNDGNACTQTDTCQGGVCTGGNPVICTPNDPCHVAGTCNPVTGLCSILPAPAGTACGAPSCANGTQTTSTCDGAGSCVPHQTSCSPFVCNLSGTACLTICATDADCVAGDYCAGGACKAKQGAGAACTASDQCVSGSCCGGVCVDLATDVQNCGGCGFACPAAQTCVSGVCAATHQCQTGTDLETGSPWVVCRADATSAWVSANNAGQYHALQICQQLGYTKLDAFGGTCGKVCGYCQPASTSCTSLGNEVYDGSGACGSDAFGPILCVTVQWRCLA